MSLGVVCTDAWERWHKTVKPNDKKVLVVFDTARRCFVMDWAVRPTHEIHHILGPVDGTTNNGALVAEALERAMAAGWEITWGGEA